MRPQNLLETSCRISASEAGKKHCNTRKNKAHSGSQSVAHPVLFTCTAVSELLCGCVGEHLKKHPTAIAHTTKKSHKDSKQCRV